MLLICVFCVCCCWLYDVLFCLCVCGVYMVCVLLVVLDGVFVLSFVCTSVLLLVLWMFVVCMFVACLLCF